MQIENDVERYLVQQAKRYGWLCLKFVSPGNAGVPDRILISPVGALVFIELKRSKKHEMRPLQAYWMAVLRKFRQPTKLIRSKAEVDEFFLHWV